jgi:hypothetical protein
MSNKIQTSDLNETLLASIMTELENKNKETYDSILYNRIKFSNV